MARRKARKTKTVTEVTMLRTQFIRWGLGLFIFRLIIGYGPPTNDLEDEERDLSALWLCVAGLIAVFSTSYIGYFVVNAIWPSFY